MSSQQLTINPHVEERLTKEPMMWLSSVRPDNRPHLVPVWFLWQNGEIVIFSQPNKQKLHNLRQNDQVMLALETLGEGHDVVLIEGRARLDPNLKATMPAYVKKYEAKIREMGWTVENMAADYSQAIIVTPTRIISWGE